MKKTILLVFLLSLVGIASAQSTQKYPPLITFTNTEDHANMMQQLGITALRLGPSGNVNQLRIMPIMTSLWQIHVRSCPTF